MKASELRPCDNCGGPLVPAPYRVRISQGMFNARATNTVMGLTQHFRGHLGLAEVFAPEPEVLLFFEDKEPALCTELLLCQECVTMKDLSLALLMERLALRIGRCG